MQRERVGELDVVDAQQERHLLGEPNHLGGQCVQGPGGRRIGRPLTEHTALGDTAHADEPRQLPGECTSAVNRGVGVPQQLAEHTALRMPLCPGAGGPQHNEPGLLRQVPQDIEKFGPSTADAGTDHRDAPPAPGSLIEHFGEFGELTVPLSQPHGCLVLRCRRSRRQHPCRRRSCRALQTPAVGMLRCRSGTAVVLSWQSSPGP